MDTVSGYEQTLNQLKREAADLITRRQQIDDRLASLTQAIDALKALIAQIDGPKLDETVAARVKNSQGLSDSIREILRTAGTPMAPTQIRDRLVQDKQFKAEDYANFLTAIHNTLHRLVVSGTIAFAEFAGRTVYVHRKEEHRKSRRQIEE